MLHTRTSQENSVTFKVVDEKRPVICGIENISVSHQKGNFLVEWDIPKIWTPENFAMEMRVEVRVTKDGKPFENIVKRGVHGVTFPANESSRYIVQVTPTLTCMYHVVGPTTKILL
ncbi:hypothetical protein [Brazilian marseillevirus]|uniref:hypothetical protein n=1 Tax=Brazilian marseillevirus TaxID=1813599 RepID=UPI0007836832|nr:hypothetical protein A3303_gp326 [Brazilian marseillevirus]AMQ10834.1 hypothetical protein [Brazilian marseillevirus]